MQVGARLGGAIAAGVPVLVLVSMGPVAELAGPPSILIWLGSALIGLLLALYFAELASSFPTVSGGMAPLSARVLRRYGRLPARAVQWSYWLAWCPAPAINALVIATYLRQSGLLDAPVWLTVLLASGVLLLSVGVNERGLRAGGRMQLTLVCAVVGVLVVLFGGAMLRDGVRLEQLRPFAPPEGWGSMGGWLALSGGLFIAAWSAYAAELSLTYSTRYRRGLRDAVRVLLTVAAASVLVFTLVPFLLVVTVGIDRVAADPLVAFAALGERAAGGALPLVLVMLALALFLGINMIAIASSWTLHQMAHNGDAWAALGRLNRHGMPGNALRFDLAVNLGLIVLMTVLSGGDLTRVPVAMLVAANVGYVVCVCLALVAAWRNHPGAPAHRLVRLRPGLVRLAPPLVGLHLVLLGTAGHAWGWRNLAAGAAILLVLVLTTHWWLGRRSPAPAAAAATPVAAAPRPPPGCWWTVPALTEPGREDPDRHRQRARKVAT